MSLLPDEAFNLELPPGGGCSFALLGSTRSGKSTLLGWILEHHFSKHIGVLMTCSPQAQVYKGMKEVLQAPKYIPKVIKEMASINKDCKNHYDFLAVLDDVVTAKFDKELLKMLTIYRNSNVSCIISLQALTLMNNNARGNVNFVILMKMNSDEQIEKIVKAYLNSYFPRGWTLLDKMREYKRLTEDHHFFCVDNLNGRVFRSKIAIHG